jgi:hypothetical protein
MIKGIMGTTGVTVSGGNTSLPYIGSNASNPVQGMIRINGTDMEVFNNTGWQTIGSSYATVSFDQDTQDLLQWARTQRTLEMNRKILIENNPALQKAYEAIQRAEANFDILSKFVEHDKENTSVLAGYNFSSSP